MLVRSNKIKVLGGFKMNKKDIEKWIIAKYKRVSIDFTASLKGSDKHKVRTLDKLIVLEDILINCFGYTTTMRHPVVQLLKDDKVIHSYIY